MLAFFAEHTDTKRLHTCNTHAINGPTGRVPKKMTNGNLEIFMAYCLPDPGGLESLQKKRLSQAKVRDLDYCAAPRLQTNQTVSS